MRRVPIVVVANLVDLVDLVVDLIVDIAGATLIHYQSNNNNVKLINSKKDESLELYFSSCSVQYNTREFRHFIDETRTIHHTICAFQASKSSTIIRLARLPPTRRLRHGVESRCYQSCLRKKFGTPMLGSETTHPRQNPGVRKIDSLHYPCNIYSNGSPRSRRSAKSAGQDGCARRKRLLK